MFKLEIKTSGSAFADPFFCEIDDIACQREIARILRGLADKLEQSSEFGKVIEYTALMDANGNKVGSAAIKR